MLPSSCSRTVPALSSLVADDRRGRVMPGNSKPLMCVVGRGCTSKGLGRLARNRNNDSLDGLFVGVSRSGGVTARDCGVAPFVISGCWGLPA
jgi:hypothetical protein